MLWLRENAAVIVSVLAVLWLGCALVRALVLAARTPPPPGAGEDFARGEKVRQDIRRRIAERKASPVVPAPPPAAAPRFPWLGGRKPIDPFGGPPRPRGWQRLRAWWEKRRSRGS